MANKVLITTVGITILFLATGVVQLALSLTARSQLGKQGHDGYETVRLALQNTFPLTASIVNGGFVLATAALALLGMARPLGRWLKTAGYLVTLCGLFSLFLGVYLWLSTLRLRDGFFVTYLYLKPGAQSLVQQTFHCCGYYNATIPAFVTDSLCFSPAAAALVPGCAPAISNFGNLLIGNLFTALFGMVGVDAVLVLSIACLLKDLEQRERYRHIEDKSGFRAF